jgi:hypothetical protein
MKLLKKTAILKLDTYFVDIPLFTSEKELKYFVRKNDVQDVDELQDNFDASDGNFCSLRDVNGIRCVMVCWCSKSIDVLVHELHHAVYFACKELGVTCYESKAYMMQSLYVQAFSVLGLSIIRD